MRKRLQTSLVVCGAQELLIARDREGAPQFPKELFVVLVSNASRRFLEYPELILRVLKPDNVADLVLTGGLCFQRQDLHLSVEVFLSNTPVVCRHDREEVGDNCDNNDRDQPTKSSISHSFLVLVPNLILPH